MNLIRLIILSLFVFTQSQADTIYNLIKIPNLEIYNLNNKILTETHITEYLNKKKEKLNMYLEEILPIIINDAENLDEALTLLTNMWIKNN